MRIRHVGMPWACVLAMAISASAVQGKAPILGYINTFPKESPEEAKRRHARVAERRASVILMVHRGDRKAAPENSLEAIAAALDAGADGVEIDIHRTKDGVLVLNHDGDMKSMFNHDEKIKNMTYYECLTKGYQRSGPYSTPETRMPTFVAFLELARQRAALIHLDVKASGLQEEIKRLLDEADMWDHIVHVNCGNADRFCPPKDEKDRTKDGWYNKLNTLGYRGWAPTWDAPDEDIIKAIREWMPKAPGKEMVFCKDPKLPTKAMHKKPVQRKPLPANLRAWWGPEGALDKPVPKVEKILRDDARSLEG